MICSLCGSPTLFFKKIRKKEYYRCSTCDAIQLHSNYFLPPEEEKARYETHNNNVEDPRYQQFVSPIVKEVLSYYKTNHIGLDFGAGTGPVISKLLSERGYKINLYDPFFWNDKQYLQSKYDFIVCCEVIEHFHSPKKEFQLLHSLIKEKGSIILMTDLYHDDIIFDTWYYKNDPTHIFFYTKNTLEYIREQYNYTNLIIKNRLIHFISR